MMIMASNSTADPRRLRRGATVTLVFAIVFWVLLVLLLLASLLALMRLAGQGLEANPGEIFGRIIAFILLNGVPLALAIGLTVRQNTLRKRAAAIEHGAAPTV
jgi:hypothetical protein